MTMERWLRLLGGLFVLVGLGLSRIYSENWLILSGLVGLSLFQSGFTNWCPMMVVLRLLGVKNGK
ncbi:MAG: DUF2892 domain-containing protein [Nitrospirae bacterium]|nr:DUF2892 domain-containing protein [Nitrospirota bacterium]